MCGIGGTWELSMPSAQFCCESTTALKNKVYSLKKKQKRTCSSSPSVVWGMD